MVSALKLFVPYHKNFHDFYDSKKVQNVGRGRSTTKSDDDKDTKIYIICWWRIEDCLADVSDDDGDGDSDDEDVDIIKMDVIKTRV